MTIETSWFVTTRLGWHNEANTFYSLASTPCSSLDSAMQSARFAVANGNKFISVHRVDLDTATGEYTFTEESRVPNGDES